MVSLRLTTYFKKSILWGALFMLGILSAYGQLPVPYGDNKETGKYIVLNGVKHYYEVYGNGTPLLLIHGNSTGIKGWAPQIPYFSEKYKVYAIDCRGRGKSDLGNDSLTYLQQAKDMAAFISELSLDSVYVLGKSDGGIVALLMGIYCPERIKKIVAFGANLWPDSTALYPPSVNEAKTGRVHADKMIALKDTTQNWRVVQQRNRMMEFQPNITADDLHKIQVPVLVMSCDRDVIREEHTFFIYKNIPQANLSIFPGEKHQVARLNPTLFNTTVARFLGEPFKGNDYRYSK